MGGATKYLSAYLLAVLGGKETPTEADVKAILEAGGCEVDAAVLKEVMKRISSSDKSITELIAEGHTKFAATGGGSGGGGAAVADTGGAAAAAGPAKEEKK